MIITALVVLVPHSSIFYRLFLGFGLSIGAEIYHQISGHEILNGDDYTCTRTHDPNGPWYQKTASTWWGERFELHLVNPFVRPH
jgi:hypothetical protein